jgi:Putative restriction endonuclease
LLRAARNGFALGLGQQRRRFVGKRATAASPARATSKGTVQFRGMTAAKKLATYDDLFALPTGLTGQIVFGMLHAHPRPALDHANAASALGAGLDGPFRRSKGGPGGWIILDKPEIHVASDIVVPDLAGWRKARVAELPRTSFVTIAPDWVCEVLSPSTAAFDRGDKLNIYARDLIAHVWFIDPVARSLEVLALDGPTYRVHDVLSGNKLIRAIPFDAAELDLGALWDMG